MQRLIAWGLSQNRFIGLLYKFVDYILSFRPGKFEVEMLWTCYAGDRLQKKLSYNCSVFHWVETGRQDTLLQGQCSPIKINH